MLDEETVRPDEVAGLGNRGGGGVPVAAPMETAMDEITSEAGAGMEPAPSSVLYVAVALGEKSPSVNAGFFIRFRTSWGFRMVRGILLRQRRRRWIQCWPIQPRKMSSLRIVMATVSKLA